MYLAALFAISLWYSVQDFSTLTMLFGTRMPDRFYGIIAVDLLILAALWGTFWVAFSEQFAIRSGKRRT